jgi:Ankyrin repeats (3 copies)/Ankyrin repeat
LAWEHLVTSPFILSLYPSANIKQLAVNMMNRDRPPGAMQDPTSAPTHHGDDSHLVLYLAAVTRHVADFCRIFNGLCEQDQERYYADTYPDEEGQDDSFSPLHFCAENGNADGVRVLAQDLNFNLNQYASRWRKTPLGCAVSEEHYDICRFLLENGADPNRGGPGYRPLYLAACNGNTEIVRLLLQHGANQNCIRGYFDDSRKNVCCTATALNILLRSRKSKETKLTICRLLVKHGGRDSKFLQTTLDKIIKTRIRHMPADDANDANNCEILLEAGVEPSYQAMHLAIKTKKEAIFRLLLQYGVDPFRQQQQLDPNEHDDADVHQHAPSPFLEAAATCGDDDTGILESLLDLWDERFAANGGKNTNGDYAIHVLLRYPDICDPAVKLVVNRQAKYLSLKPGFFPFGLAENARLDVIYFVLRYCANDLIQLLPTTTTATTTSKRNVIIDGL